MRFYEYNAIVKRIQADGTEKNVSESYLVEDDTFESASVKGATYMVAMYSEFETTGCIVTNIVEHLGDDKGEYIVKAGVDIITIDEKTNKEKKHRVNYILHADSIAEAGQKLSDVMNVTMTQYHTKECKITKYIDIIK